MCTRVADQLLYIIIVRNGRKKGEKYNVLFVCSLKNAQSRRIFKFVLRFYYICPLLMANKIKVLCNTFSRDDSAVSFQRCPATTTSRLYGQIVQTLKS